MARLTTDAMWSGVSLTDILSTPTDKQTYKNLFYLSLAFPLGMIYYMITTFGLVLGIGLSVLGIGIAILIGTILGLRFVASFERFLANKLLGTNIVAPDDVETAGLGKVATVKVYLKASSTWRGLSFILLKFPLGLLSFIFVVTLLGTAIELTLLPIYPNGILNVELFGWVVAESFGTQTNQVIAVPIGLCLGILGLPLLNKFANMNALIASSLLGQTES